MLVEVTQLNGSQCILNPSGDDVGLYSETNSVSQCVLVSK